MSDFSGHVVSIRNHMGEEASMFTGQKHISMANQSVIKKLGAKLRKLQITSSESLENTVGSFASVPQDGR
jgi:hypothetical protein